MIDYSDFPPDLAYLLREIEREINALFDEFESSEIKAIGGSLAVWQGKMESILTRFHQAAYMVGAKVKDLVVKDIQSIKDFVTLQLNYFRNFVEEIKTAGTKLWKQWRNRSIRYGEAIKTLYWKGKNRDIPLPAQPGEGTFCHCGCYWDVTTLDENKGDFDAYWRRGKKDSCDICVEREKIWKPLRIRNWEITGSFTTPFLSKEFHGALEELLYGCSH